MKVVHILNRIEYSGAEIMLFQASDIFKKHELQTTLLSCELKKGEFEDQMQNVGYVINSAAAKGNIGFIINFYKYFKSNKFDVVHIHTEHLYLWKVIALRLTGHQNIIRSFHSTWSFKGWLRLKRILHRKLATCLGLKKHAISIEVQKNERHRFHNESFVVNNWIKLNKGLLQTKDTCRSIMRKELNIDPKSFVIISVGGCNKGKNHVFIINLISLLDKSGLNITYLHVGTGALEVEEKALCERLLLNQKVIFTGNRKDVPELLMCADLFLMPSSYEGLSIALLEAMYYNGLVIVNDAPGLNNMIINDKTGYVLDINDPTAYVNLIKKLIAKELDTGRIKLSAKEFVKNNYSMEVNAEALINFYKL